MPLLEVDIVTTNPVYASDGTPFSGAKVVWSLDRNDIDVPTNSPVIASTLQSVAYLDADGKLPALGMQLWANSRGRSGSRWIIGVKRDDKYVLGPVSVFVTPPTNPATNLELFALLNDPLAVSPAYLNPKNC